MARQWLIPGLGVVNEDGAKEYLIPGFGIVNENQLASAPDSDTILFTPGEHQPIIERYVFIRY